ncbi:MAG: rod shape-determining protein MreC [Alphaproteobacteria bacterium]|nr:rod shape-determining protein MreC [Alphaproteobacteria bacterium]
MLIGKIETVLVEEMRARVGDAVAPLLGAISRPIATVKRVGEQVDELVSLRLESERLRDDNARLLMWQALAQRYEVENRRLRDLLNLVPDPAASFVTAPVIGDTGGPFLRNLLLGAGARDGVQRLNVVMSGQGVVGRILQVGERSARVLLLTDLNSRIPVLVGGGGERAVLAGDNTDQPQLFYLTSEAEIAVGDRVVTSGLGGVFPAYLPVGVVTRVTGRTARIQPYVDGRRLTYVRVVDYRIVPPPEAGPR